jgi:hypothetical protein
MPGFTDALRGYAHPTHRRDGFRCRYCGLDGTSSFGSWLSLSWDHLLPKNDSRRNDTDYIVTACMFCNVADNRYFDWRRSVGCASRASRQTSWSLSGCHTSKPRARATATSGMRTSIKATSPRQTADESTRVLERLVTQKQLGWHLARSALIPDLEEGQYFNDQTSRSCGALAVARVRPAAAMQGIQVASRWRWSCRGHYHGLAELN